MNKYNLKCGNVVETGDGERYLFTYYDGKYIFVDLNGDGYYYFDTLRFDNNCNNSLIAIMKVYKDYTLKEVLWERKEPIKLTDDERVILMNIDKRYKWIARDESGKLYIFINKPYKIDFLWYAVDSIDDLSVFRHLFQSVKWEDEEPYLIEDLLKGE